MEGSGVLAPTARSGSFVGSAGRATLALIGLRIIYAYNWFTVGPALPAIGNEFVVGPAAWGALLAAFFVGAGLLQVPAGLLAARWGTRRTSLIGAGLLGGAALASGFAPDFFALLFLRGLTGAGAGLFFSPAIALVASLHAPGGRGVPVGVFSSAYSAGAGLGVFVTALILPGVGWRWSLAIGGIAMLVLLATTAGVIPRGAGAPPPRERSRFAGARRVLRSAAVWAIGLGFVGLEGASLSAGQYFVPYAEIARGWGAAWAGAVGALFVFPSFFGGPVGGTLAERHANRRTQLVLLTAAPALLLIAIPYVGDATVATIAVLFSFSFGMVYAIMYLLPSYLPGLGAEELPLAIGLFNGIQLAGGAAVASLVGWSVGRYGYPVAWWLLGGLAALTLVALIWLPATPRAPSSARAGDAPR
jgi:MFS family permease